MTKPSMTEAMLQREAEAFVMECLVLFDQIETPETVSDVAAKIVRSLPASIRRRALEEGQG